MVVSTSLITGAMSESAGAQLVDGKRFVGVFFFANNVEREAFGDFFEDALGLLGLLEQIGDLGKRGDFDAQLLAEQDGQLVDQAEVARIGQGDFERTVMGLNRHEIVPEHQVDRDGMEQVVIDAGFAKVDELVIVALGHGAGARGFLGGVYESIDSGHGLPGDTPVLRDLDAPGPGRVQDKGRPPIHAASHR